MPIVQKYKDIFRESQTSPVRRIHRFGIVFGIVLPLVYLLVTALKTGDAFGFWPSSLSQGFVHLYVFGWVGMYVFGLVAYLLPELMEVAPTIQERITMRFATYMYAGGVALMVLPAIGITYTDGAGIWLWGDAFAALLRGIAWVSLLVMILRWWKQSMERFSVQHLLVLVGVGTVAVSFIQQVGFHALESIRGIHQVKEPLFMMLLPMTGVSLIVLAFLLRMIPELLGWRPVQDRRTKIIMLVLGVSMFVNVITYAGFYILGGTHTLFSVLHITSGAGLFLGVAGLLLSMDIFHVRLAPLVNKEHVSYIYASFLWLLLATGIYWVGSVWEAVQGRPIYEAWGDGLLLATVAGFFAMGLMGIYTYWVNQSPSAYNHSDRLVTVALILWSWVLVLRVFVYPFTVLSAWPGAFVFRWILDALLVVSIALVSADLYYGLYGHPWRSRKQEY